MKMPENCPADILTSHNVPKSVLYLGLKRTRKPLFLQLETTKALKKLKIEKKNPVCRIEPKKLKGGTLWDYMNIHSVAKYQKLMGGTIEKFRKKMRNLNSISIHIPK